MIKYRRSYFKSIPMHDMVKMSLLEVFINDLTDASVRIFTQDVMSMTIKDLIRFPAQLLMFIILPAYSLAEFRRYKVYSDEDAGWCSDRVTIYWRDVSDFSVKPSRWRE